VSIRVFRSPPATGLASPEALLVSFFSVPNRRLNLAGVSRRLCLARGKGRSTTLPGVDWRGPHTLLYVRKSALRRINQHDSPVLTSS